MKFELNGEFIRLGDLLKAAGLTGTGGEAKQAVQDGLVNVDRKVCTERGHKIRAGQKVQFKDQTIEVGCTGKFLTCSYIISLCREKFIFPLHYIKQ